MQTNILLFLLFSIIAALVIHILPPALKKYGLLALNIIFYLSCDARFFLLMLLSICWSFLIGRQVENATARKKLWLWMGIIPIIFILAVFKYFNFFILSGNTSLTLLMPLGISYYTFKIISYLADIYLGKRSPEPSPVNYTIYVSFFPQIICGPISRSEEVTKELEHLQSPSNELVSNGFLLILSGLLKKLVIADRLSSYVDIVFASPSSYPGLALWMSAFFYTIQLYCDFAGYSEIAIGVGNLLGIPCKPNFNLPYFSYSIKDFWNRWHISLSSWLKDYIYIPLGGNRKGRIRQKINIMITFLVSGLWHGNGFNFILWGLWHGILNLLPASKSSCKWKTVLQTISTFICVMFGWIIFRAESIKSGGIFLKQMFLNFSLSYQSIVASILPFTNDYACLSYFLTVCFFIMILFFIEWRQFSGKSDSSQKSNHWKCFLYTISIILFGMIGNNSFLYANF